MEKAVDIKNKFYNKIIVWTVDNKLRLDKHVENIYQRLGEIKLCCNIGRLCGSN